MSRPSDDDLKYWVDAGLTTTEIGAMYRRAPGTVRTWLREAGLSRPSGPIPLQLCANGLHDMSEHSAPVATGGRRCIPCNNAYKADYYQTVTKQKVQP